MELVSGRSFFWGGGITASFARQRALKTKSPDLFPNREERNLWARVSVAGFGAKLSSSSEGWLVKEGSQKMVRRW